jgi:hypothetical protein
VKAGKQILLEDLSWIEETANLSRETLLNLEKDIIL